MLINSIANAMACKTQTDSISAGQAAICAEKEGSRGETAAGERGGISSPIIGRPEKPGPSSHASTLGIFGISIFCSNCKFFFNDFNGRVTRDMGIDFIGLSPT